MPKASLTKMYLIFFFLLFSLVHVPSTNMDETRCMTYTKASHIRSMGVTLVCECIIFRVSCYKHLEIFK